MYGLLRSGPYFVTAAVAQGSKLIRNNKSRMASRRARRRTKRTRR